MGFWGKAFLDYGKTLKQEEVPSPVWKEGYVFISIKKVDRAKTCGLREPSSVKHLDDWESCAPPGLRRLPGGPPGKIPALRTRARAAVGHAARVRGSAVGACQCARQAGRRASPASVGASVSASVSASAAAARGSLGPAASDKPLGRGAPPTLGSAHSAAERARLGLCDPAVPLPLPFLPPGEEQGSLRLLRTAPSGASRGPWRTGPRARRSRRRHSAGDRTSGGGGGAAPAEASRGPADGPCQLRAAPARLPRRRALARRGIATGRGGAPGCVLSGRRAKGPAAAPAPPHYRRLPTARGPAVPPRAPRRRRGARPDRERKTREAGTEGEESIRTPGEKPSRLKAREHSSQHQRAQVPHHSSAAQEEKGKRPDGF
ncbi:serine/arginine repetitive matrix protein 3-like [Mustela erminea]|uniref:serine/arginine repetitive matrix protein 3-like n=1 Tax=Mustela erminea TaxID=36723 RepID=UPI00138710DD|nr:serine/arginine repetitive matrix protein 3-like [Mustela erminea]